MNFKERGKIPSCSSLGRVKNCGGSWALSKGTEDDPSEHAEKGQDVHDLLKEIIEGRLKNPKTDEENLAWRLWTHMQKAAFDMYRDIELVWESEKRLWLTNDNLEPILSGQFDAVCYPANGVEGPIAIFDAKTGWQSGDVPKASKNEQMMGLAELVWDQYGRTPYGAIVREWACDELEVIEPGRIRSLAEAIHDGEYDVWHKAGLKTGGWCQFCPAKGNCPAYRESLSMVVAEGSVEMAIETMAPENLVRILRASPMAEKVIEAAKKEAHRRREAGAELPGVIWAKGNTKREIADEAKFGLRMAAEGIDLGTFSKTTIPIGAAYKAWLKHKGLKDNKQAKDDFNRAFEDCLEFKENNPSITFNEP